MVSIEPLYSFQRQFDLLDMDSWYYKDIFCAVWVGLMWLPHYGVLVHGDERWLVLFRLEKISSNILTSRTNVRLERQAFVLKGLDEVLQ
jgi:hypothetical protein